MPQVIDMLRGRVLVRMSFMKLSDKVSQIVPYRAVR